MYRFSQPDALSDTLRLNLFSIIGALIVKPHRSILFHVLLFLLSLVLPMQPSDLEADDQFRLAKLESNERAWQALPKPLVGEGVPLP